MKKIALVMMLLTATLGFGQRFRQAPPTAVINTQSGSQIFQNEMGAMTISIEELINGAPATVSVITYGCMRGGTCDAALDTYATVANSIRKPAPTTIYDFFLVQATWTGGASVNIQLNVTMTVSK
jgi:hypothetical protein